jgi:hypothetical protein|tara:strand:+ start:2812 stop:3126 length:315 start_codon:yes stop_codon:yes gene_type:complete
MFYILENGEPKKVNDISEWSRWFDDLSKRVIKQTLVSVAGKTVEISTIFTGTHMYPSKPLMLWETMIFGGKYDLWREKYSSEEEALLKHEDLCVMVLKNEELEL